MSMNSNLPYIEIYISYSYDISCKESHHILEYEVMFMNKSVAFFYVIMVMMIMVMMMMMMMMMMIMM